jgi:hypothetical protein
VPATRSRTENWRQTLQGVYERGGALEIALPHHAEDAAQGVQDQSAANLIWRVKILGMTETEIIVEQPTALGHAIPIAAGMDLVGILAIGQNRWMFRTANLGASSVPAGMGRTIPAYRLRMPDQVERVQRRNFYRISTLGLTLPRVECYPLMNPDTAPVAEAANRCEILDLLDAPLIGCPIEPARQPVMPEVGPMFHSMLVNIGGGGVGLLIDPDDRPSLDAGDLLWLRVSLMPHIPVPLAVTARVKHTHIDSSQRTYAGLAFEFGWHPEHSKFVIDQLCRYVAQLQREQMSRPSA